MKSPLTKTAGIVLTIVILLLAVSSAFLFFNTPGKKTKTAQTTPSPTTIQATPSPTIIPLSESEVDSRLSQTLKQIDDTLAQIDTDLNAINKISITEDVNAL